MKRFEYTIASKTYDNILLTVPTEDWQAAFDKQRTEFIEWMNSFGGVGWEIIDIVRAESGMSLCLKREIP